MTTQRIALFFRRLFTTLFTKSPEIVRCDYVLGFGTTVVGSGEEAKVSVRPRVAFRPERLVVPSDVAHHFQVKSVTVGHVEQLASVGSLPAVMFTEHTSDVRLKMTEASPTDFVTVVVANTSRDEQVFKCGVCGPAV